MRKKPSHPKTEKPQDFWDLGDDLGDTENNPEADAGTEGPIDTAPAPPSGDDSVIPAPRNESDDDADPAESGDADYGAPPEEVEPEPMRTKQTRRSSRREEASQSSSHRKEATPTSMLEKISLGVLLACLLGALGWGISYFNRDAPNGTLVEFIEDYPAQGEQVTIVAVDTWWRKPVRSGDNPDTDVVIDANLIPCVNIKLAEGGSTILRVTFRQGNNSLVGDTINLAVENGKFTDNGSDEITVHATSGFINPSRINAYTNEDIDPWSVSIIEGSSSDDPLVKARVSAKTQDKEN